MEVSTGLVNQTFNTILPVYFVITLSLVYFTVVKDQFSEQAFQAMTTAGRVVSCQDILPQEIDSRIFNGFRDHART
jgi:hypothetical protein